MMAPQTQLNNLEMYLCYFTDKMAWQNDMMRELEILSAKVCNKENELNIVVDNIEEEIKASSAKKKGIILNEMKKILVKLNDIEKKVVNDLKLDAHAFLHDAANLSHDVSTFKNAVECASDFDISWKSELLHLKDKVNLLKTEDLSSCMDISVQIEPDLFHAGFEDVLQSIHLELPDLKPKKVLRNDFKKSERFIILGKMYESVLYDESKCVSNYVLQCFTIQN